MPRVAQLPRGWRRWSPAEKIEHLLVMSLDQGHEILSWPVAELDPPQLAVQEQMRHVMYVAGLSALLDGTLGREAARERERERVLARPISELPAPPFSRCQALWKTGWASGVTPIFGVFSMSQQILLTRNQPIAFVKVQLD
jgi:hypothetical protein